MDKGVNLTQIYVDTVGPPDSYQEKLARMFPQVPRIVVTKKADSIYPIVSAASIVAKVMRDRVLRYWKFAEGVELEDIPSCRNFGSGYPSDPNTVGWLKGSAGLDKVFGGPSIERFSWSTITKINEEDCVAVEWYTCPRLANVFSGEIMKQKQKRNQLQTFSKQEQSSLSEIYCLSVECVYPLFVPFEMYACKSLILSLVFIASFSVVLHFALLSISSQ